jgi:diguanylate cyclase (GGDEF)-like protein
MADHGERGRVLIVDDEPENVRMLHETLRGSYRISATLTGREALKIAALIQPDLVLLDIRMPDMDGYEVCQTMQADPLLRRIPVIFVTTLTGDGEEGVGLTLGAMDYITKPFRPAIVKQRVAIHLELKRQRDQLSRLLIADGLTGIPNRRAFDERLDQEWRRAVRSGTQLSLAMIDIDRFKQYNDTCGHLAGDDCLRRVAQTLHETFTRAGDFVARYGGEEFACIMPGTAEPGLAAISEIARTAVESLTIPHSASGVSPFVTISIGGACCLPTLETSPELLIARADEQLYRSKSLGRNRVNSATI